MNVEWWIDFEDGKDQSDVSTLNFKLVELERSFLIFSTHQASREV
jgi:hypothetical protein